MTRQPAPAMFQFAGACAAALVLAGCSHSGGASVAEDDGCPRFLGHNACEMERAQHGQPVAMAAPAPQPPQPVTAPAPAPEPAQVPAPAFANPPAAAPSPVAVPVPPPSVATPLPVPAPVVASAPSPASPAAKPVHRFFWQADKAAPPAAPKPETQARKPSPPHFFWQQPAQPPQPPIVGGYQTATDRKGVEAAAAFALHESPLYVLKGIDSAKTQIVAGTNYSLCLWVRQIAHEANPIHRRMVAATVFQGLDGHYELTSWHEVGTCHAGS